jgi:hypothetical protein
LPPTAPSAPLPPKLNLAPPNIVLPQATQPKTASSPWSVTTETPPAPGIPPRPAKPWRGIPTPPAPPPPK